MKPKSSSNETVQLEHSESSVNLPQTESKCVDPGHPVLKQTNPNLFHVIAPYTKISAYQIAPYFKDASPNSPVRKLPQKQVIKTCLNNKCQWNLMLEQCIKFLHKATKGWLPKLFKLTLYSLSMVWDGLLRVTVPSHNTNSSYTVSSKRLEAGLYLYEIPARDGSRKYNWYAISDWILRSYSWTLIPTGRSVWSW